MRRRKVGEKLSTIQVCSMDGFSPCFLHLFSLHANGLNVEKTGGENKCRNCPRLDVEKMNRKNCSLYRNCRELSPPSIFSSFSLIQRDFRGPFRWEENDKQHISTPWGKEEKTRGGESPCPGVTTSLIVILHHVWIEGRKLC